MKNLSISQLRKKLDIVFSIWVRNRDADWRGDVVCITCSRTFPWKEVDAGHYISRRHPSTRWHEKNVHAQCKGCNRYRGGAPDEYALALQRKYGENILQELNREKNKDKKWKIQELRNMITKYTL